MSKLMKLVQAVDAASRRVHTFALLALSLVLLAPSAWAEKISLSVFGTTVADKFYDGTTDAKTLVTAGTLEGDVQPGDDVKLSVIDAQFDNKNAGGDKEVSIRYELNGKDAEKYELAENPVTMTASIMEKVLTVAPTYKDYDGSTAITLNADGVVEGDDVTLEGTLASPEAGTQNVTGLNLSGTDAGNYQLTQSSATAYVRVNLADGQSYTLLPGTYSNSVKCVKGGAAYVSTGATLTGTNVTFAGNSAGEEGGAIYNNGKIAFDGAIDFSDNVSVSDGGAISTGGEATFAGAATFERNSGLFGGAIANSGVLTFAARATFTDNKATGDSNAGGAIENFGGIITFNDVAVFSGNSADSGGAIYNENNDDPVTIGVINFAGLVDLQTAGDTWYNKEKTIVNWDLTGGLEQYGCISHFERYANEKANVKQLISVTDDQPVGDYVIASGDFTDVKNKNAFLITNVTVGGEAPAARINGDMVFLSADKLTGYKLVTEEAGETTNLVLKISKYTCAREIAFGQKSPYVLTNFTYTAAPTTDFGGAFYVNGDATLTGSNVTFAANCAGSGAAIYNNGTVALKDTAFSGNKLTGAGNGGAICNSGTLSLDGVTFEDNKAGLSGAVFNYVTINLDGAVTLVTTNDTIFNINTLNWNLADGKQGVLNGYDKLSNGGNNAKLQLTIDAATVLPAVIATGDFTNVAGKDTFTIKNGGATATIKIGGDIVNVGGAWRELKTVEAGTTTNLVFGLPPMAKLSKVEIIDATTGATNATAKVSVGAAEVAPNADGSYTVPKGQSITVVYTATDDYMFDRFGAKTKTVTVGPLTEDYAMTDDDKPATEAAWVDVREIAIDTRERIIVVSPEEVLPIAYSTNNWGEVTADQTKVYYFRDGEYGQTVVDTTNENGYVEWQPTDEEYGKYTFYQSWYGSNQYVAKTNATIYYGADYQFVYDEDAFIFVKRNADDEYGMSNLEDVTSYSLLHLTAQPEYTNVDRYELAGWKVYSYAERNTGWKTAVEAPELLKNFGDPTAVETTFEMPFTNVFVSCSYQWKSNYTETVEVGPGVYDAWEIHEGETYKAGITTTNGSIVSLRGTVNPGTVTLNPGATNVWDFTKGGRPYFTDFDSGFKLDSQATLLIRFDETLTNGTYKIADYAFSAEKETFEITNGVEAEDCTVVGQDDLKTAAWTYVGAKRFKLGCDSFGYLRLVVEWGIRQSVVIASDFSANPPFENAETNEFGEVVSFDWNGRTWTVGKDAFTSFTDLFTNEMYAVGATNLHVFGAQTIASEPPMGNTWNLDLVAYEDAEGNEAAAIVTVGTTGITPNTELVNITNELGAITGKGVIVLGKTSDKVDPSIYDEFIKGDIDVVNTGVEPKKGLAGNVRFEVNDKAKTETDEETGATAVVLPGVENPDGDYTLVVDSAATNDVLVAGTIKAAGNVTIVNSSTNELILAAVIEAKNVRIDNDGKISGVEGSIRAMEIVAKGDVRIDNAAHLEANVIAEGGILINNGSVNTIVGTYEGKTVTIEGSKAGAISNVTFVSDGPVMMNGVNILTGPFTINALGGVITNDGTLAWNVSGDNQAASLADFDAIVNTENAELDIQVDADQTDGDVCGIYTLAENAASAAGKIFALTGGTLSTNIVVNGEQLYIGQKEYTLTNRNDELVFSVQWGVSDERRAAYIASVKKDAAQAIADIEAVETLTPDEIAALSKQVNNAAEKALNVLATVRKPSVAEQAIKDFAAACKTVLAIAESAAEGMVRFAQHQYETEGDTAFEILVYGGSTNCSTAATLNFVRGTYTTRPQIYIDGEKAKFPLALNWEKGDRSPKTITLVIARSSSKTDRFFTLQLGSEVASTIGALDVATVSVLGGKGADETPYVRALAWPANGGKVTGSRKLLSARSKATLLAKANKWATFAGWYRAKADNPEQIDLENGFVSADRRIKVTADAAGTYFAYFTDVLPVIAVDDPDLSVASGIAADEDGVATCSVGLNVVLPLSFTTADGDNTGRLAVSKLPKGLKYNRKTGLVTGVPSKAGVYEVQLKGKNRSGKHTLVYTIVVLPIDEAIVGTFTGDLLAADKSVVGEVTVRVAKAAALTVTVDCGGRYRFAGKGFVDAEDCDAVLERSRVGTVLLKIGRDAAGNPDGSYSGIVEGEKFDGQLHFTVR